MYQMATTHFRRRGVRPSKATTCSVPLRRRTPNADPLQVNLPYGTDESHPGTFGGVAALDEPRGRPRSATPAATTRAVAKESQPVTSRPGALRRTVPPPRRSGLTNGSAAGPTKTLETLAEHAPQQASPLHRNCRPMPPHRTATRLKSRTISSPSEFASTTRGGSGASTEPRTTAAGIYTRTNRSPSAPTRGSPRQPHRIRS